jgi:phenylacetate-CoA ligase
MNPILRETVRQAFGIEVFDHYGQAEITAMFHDCELHKGMHVDWEYGYVELIPSDHPGLFKIIATNLHNNSMPLIRYDTGDLAEGYWTKCSCGRTSPIIRSINGRADDFIITKDGSRISTVNIYTFFSKKHIIRQFQIIQEEKGVLNINVSTTKFNNSEDEIAKELKNIENELTNKTKLTINITISPSFIQSTEGKFVTFIQKIKK